MSSGRRDSSDSRRRRVLVYQSLSQEEAPNAAERRKVEQLRRARRLPTTYGGNVNRRLRGRWFSLVPVRRRAMAACGLIIMGVVALLCLGHWAATGWQPLVERPEAARPLRLDRADSFGTWVRAFFLAATTGTTILVYQLRRYRNDDYRGSYRIWPPVIILIGLASLNAVAGLIPWAGELIDWLLGRRVAMAGGDWLRIVLTVGGAALALRLVAEVRSSRLALVLMLATVTFFAIPLAAHWSIFGQDTRFRWLLVSSAPLIASALLWLASAAYLRRLFREVRRMDEDDPVSLRWQQMKADFWRRWSRQAKEESAEEAAAKPTRVAKTKTVEPAVATTTRNEPAVATTAAKVTKKTVEQPAAGDPDTDDDAADAPPRRRFGLGFLFRKQRPQVETPDEGDVAANEPSKRAPVAQPTATPAVKPLAAAPAAGPLAGREAVKPVAAKPVAATPAQQPAAEESDDDQPQPTKSGWLGGWFGRKKSSAAAAEEEPSATVTASKSDRPPGSGASGDDDDESFEDDPSIDWSKMNKSERRRMRREIKRTA